MRSAMSGVRALSRPGAPIVLCVSVSNLTVSLINLSQLLRPHLGRRSKTSRKSFDDGPSDGSIQLLGNVLSLNAVRLRDCRHQCLGDAEGLSKTANEARLRHGVHTVLCDAQLVQEHAPVGFFKTPIMTGDRNGFMQGEIGEHECVGVCLNQGGC